MAAGVTARHDGDMSPRAGSSAPTDRPNIRFGVATATGHRRPLNEDDVLAGPDWYVVADGMGGHLAGEVASTLAVETFGGAPRAASIDDVHRVVAGANAAVLGRADHDGAPGMGTTVVGATVLAEPAGRVAVFHVGDSRCYRLLDGVLDLVTTDHSYVQELVDAGVLDPAHVRTHPMRNVVTRALGLERDTRADIVALESGGRLLLCSDGLSGELDARSIGRVLAGFGDPQEAADRLVELALAGAARDNVTAVVVDVTTPARDR